MELKIKLLHPYAVVPDYSSAGAACFDLRNLSNNLYTEEVTVQPGQAQFFHTGLAFEVPDGWVLKIYSRSGHGFKNGIRLVNGTGIIDSDYRGEVMVGLHNDGNADFVVHDGDRIAQAMLERVERVSFVQVEELSDTVRGAGGMGSTGS